MTMSLSFWIGIFAKKKHGPERDAALNTTLRYSHDEETPFQPVNTINNNILTIKKWWNRNQRHFSVIFRRYFEEKTFANITRKKSQEIAQGANITNFKTLFIYQQNVRYSVNVSILFFFISFCSKLK